jgi:hypothetical protein
LSELALQPAELPECWLCQTGDIRVEIGKVIVSSVSCLGPDTDSLRRRWSCKEVKVESPHGSGTHSLHSSWSFTYAVASADGEVIANARETLPVCENCLLVLARAVNRRVASGTLSVECQIECQNEEWGPWGNDGKSLFHAMTPGWRAQQGWMTKCTERLRDISGRTDDPGLSDGGTRYSVSVRLRGANTPPQPETCKHRSYD